MRSFVLVLTILVFFCSGVAVALSPGAAGAATDVPAKPQTGTPQGWNQAAAAKYLDDREVWWQEWPHAQKDHGTVCISCHTQVPYALARPLLRGAMGEHAVSDPERVMLDSILKRVKLGNEAETFYSDAKNGPGKTQEARNAEAVFNAVILTSYDAASAEKHLLPETRMALEAMWALQEKTGPKTGAWIWQNFHYSPWEAPESEYFGAAMVMMSVGSAPDNYRADAKIQGNMTLLRTYLLDKMAQQPIANKMVLLWASARMPGLLTEAQQESIANEIYSKQQSDGGWCLTTLGEGVWDRRDKTPFETRSDGYATGLALLALEETDMTRGGQHADAAKRGITWLLANQSKADGRWPAWSVNKERDPESGVGKFMSDAGTAFAVMALEEASTLPDTKKSSAKSAAVSKGR